MADAEEKLVLKPGGVTQYMSSPMQSDDSETFFLGELNLCNRRVESLAKSMEEVKETRKCDLSLNNIADINPMKDMQQLVHLNLAKNKIKALTLFTNEEAFPNLRWLDVSTNKYVELPAIKLPKLEYLDISYNKVEKVNEGWTGHANLRILKSIDNKFKNLAPFKQMPKLEELYLQANAVTALAGWESLPELRKLNLRRNKIEKIDEEMPAMEKLEYLNLRANKLTEMAMVERLYVFPKLIDLNVINNPVEQAASSFNVFLAEVLCKRPSMKRFCKVDVAESNLLEATFLAQFKHEKAEKKRKEEEAAAAAAEAAANE